jgi:hypothetical protein
MQKGRYIVQLQKPPASFLEGDTMSRASGQTAMVILSSALLCFTVNAQSINITGSVVDNGTSTGIANAKVILVEIPSCTTRTDANGNFTLSGSTATEPPVTISKSGYNVALSGNRLLVNTAGHSIGITVDVFTILGEQISHTKKLAAGMTEFTSLWKAPGLYYVKVQVGNEVRILSSFGSNQNLTVVSRIDNSPIGLAKTSAVYTIEAGKSGYDSKQVTMNATTGSAGVIRLSTYSQALGTWKEAIYDTSARTGYGGILSVVLDPVRPSDCWFGAVDRGYYKSTDYGRTWTKVNVPTTVYGTDMNSGRPWYFAIDKNPHRDPATIPTLYTVLGYGSAGPFKSVDGGITWTKTWNNNVYAADGITNISADVGTDMQLVLTCDTTGPNHLIAATRGNYAGFFESTDGGGKWILRPNSNFTIGAHFDRPFIIDSSTWCVVQSSGQVWRTTDRGATWALASGTMATMSARCMLYLGSTIYAGSQISGLYKTTDKGATWTNIRPTGVNGWIVASATKLYINSCPNNGGTGQQTMYQASIGNDAVWTAVPGATNYCSTSLGSPYDAVCTFDGTHYIIIAANQDAGLWRYVEP